ncbi:MAG TPA: hypothetical protein PK530_03750 [Anaerolineales bacterium]|nr:hypothetical protein [Anaerolineales bacterium]
MAGRWHNRIRLRESTQNGVIPAGDVVHEAEVVGVGASVQIYFGQVRAQPLGEAERRAFGESFNAGALERVKN